MSADWQQFLEYFEAGGTPPPRPPAVPSQPPDRVGLRVPASAPEAPAPQAAPPSGSEPPVPPGERLAQLMSLEERLESCEEQLALAPLPVEDPARSRREQKRERQPRIRAVRSRLKLLGYPLRNEHGGHVDVWLRQVLKRFQAEAGLTVDGWVGEQTWEALQEFITLEPPLDLERWYPARGPRTALVRAISLRLGTLGFDTPIHTRLEPLRQPLAAFKAVVHALGLTPHAPERLSDREAVRLLFDDELLLSEALVLKEPPRLEQPEAVSPTSRLVRRLVRCELWMMGYEVGRLDLPTDDEAAREKLRAALRAFWSDQPEAPEAQALEARVNRLDVELLEALRQEHQRASEVSHPHLADFASQHEPQLRDVWTLGLERNPVFFLWDGVQRGARWLGRRIQDARGAVASIPQLLRRGWEYARTFFWNVLRFVYQRSSDAFTAIRKAINVLLEGLQPYLEGQVSEGQGEGRVACRLRLDADISVLLGPRASPEQLRHLAMRLERTSSCVSVGARVLAPISGMLGRVALGPAGWMSLLPALLRHLPELGTQAAALARLPPLPPMAVTERNKAWRLAAAAALLAAGLGALWWRWTH